MAEGSGPRQFSKSVRPTSASPLHSPRSAGGQVTVTLRGLTGQEDVRCQVARNGALRGAMADACEAWGRPQFNMVFKFQGHEVRPDDTPDLIGMKDGGVLEVEAQRRTDAEAPDFQMTTTKTLERAQTGRALAESKAQLRALSREQELMAMAPAAATGSGKAQAGRPLDLEWTCPSCAAIHPAATASVKQDPQLHCKRCGWKGHPRLRQLSGTWAEKEKAIHQGGPPSRAEKGKGKGKAAPKADIRAAARKVSKVSAALSAVSGVTSRSTASESAPGGGKATPPTLKTVGASGKELHLDHVGQVVEAPVGGMIAMVGEVQRTQQCVGLICYFLFCANFVFIISLLRPVSKMNDIQTAIYRELATEPISLASRPQTLLDAQDWGDVWDWVDRVLVDKVYAESYYGERVLGGVAVPKGTAKAPYSRFTLGKYNRVVSAIRFRQVRVAPTLPQCEKNETTGQRPTEYERACTMDPLDWYESCNTPAESHKLSRPCWGGWSDAVHDVEYPSKFQLESVQAARDDAHPERDLLCPQICDEVILSGLQTAPTPAMLAWVLTFQDVEDPQGSADACRAACDNSRTSLLGNLSDMPGFCGSSADKPGNRAPKDSLGCWGDVVDMPLNATEARRLVAAMRRERWTSEGTRSFAIDLNTYNPNLDIATAVRVIVEAEAGGRLVPAIGIYSVPLHLYRTTFDYVRAASEGVHFCAILNFFFHEVRQMIKLRTGYLRDIWNYIELSNIVVYFTLIAMYAHFVIAEHKTLNNFGQRSPNDYFDLYTIAVSFNNIYLLSFNFLVGTVRFLKHLRFHSQFEQLWETVRRSMRGILPIFAIYLTILFGFACAGHWIFGMQSFMFHSLPRSMMTLTLSVKDGIDYQEISSAAPVMAALFHFSWFVASWAVLNNMIIAITLPCYRAAKDRYSKVENVRLKAIAQGTNLPSPLMNLLHGLLPKTVWRFSGLEAVEAREVSRELEELLTGVDLHLLWKRLLRAAELDELAVDAEGLSFLFNGSEKDARMFISRACVAGGLKRVELPKVVTTETFIADAGAAIKRLETQLTACSSEIQAEFPEVKVLLDQREVPVREDSERVQQRKITLKENAERRAKMWKSTVPPPEKGDLVSAANSLHKERLKMNELTEEAATHSLTAGVLKEESLRSYVQAGAVRRRHGAVSPVVPVDSG